MTQLTSGPGPLWSDVNWQVSYRWSRVIEEFFTSDLGTKQVSFH